MTQASYVSLIQDEVEDHSTRGEAIIVQAVIDTYQHILLYAAKYLVGSTEEDVVANTSNRYITPVNSYSEVRRVLYHSATDTNFKTLKPISEDIYYASQVNSETGELTGWYQVGSRIYFDRVPDSAGTVKVVGIVVQDELEDEEVSVIPDRFTRVILLGSIARFKAYESLPDANEYLSQYQGPFGKQGRIEGALGDMLRELSTKTPVKKPLLFGR